MWVHQQSAMLFACSGCGQHVVQYTAPENHDERILRVSSVMQQQRRPCRPAELCASLQLTARTVCSTCKDSRKDRH